MSISEITAAHVLEVETAVVLLSVCMLACKSKLMANVEVQISAKQNPEIRCKSHISVIANCIVHYPKN